MKYIIQLLWKSIFTIIIVIFYILVIILHIIWHFKLPDKQDFEVELDSSDDIIFPQTKKLDWREGVIYKTIFHAIWDINGKIKWMGL